VRSEIDALHKVDHRNIVRIFDVLETSTHWIIVQEFIDGQSLQELLVTTGALAEADAAMYFEQLLSAVQHAHAVGVAHGDIQCNNCLIDDYDNLLLIDFGNCTIFPSPASGPAIIASQDRVVNRQCSAPEELLLGRRIDAMAVDLWHCGAVLHMLLTGHPPLAASAPGANANGSAVDMNAVRALHLSEEAVDLLQMLLHPNPKKRGNISTAW